MAQTLYDFSLATIDGAPKSLSDYRGKAVLVVNVASRCGLTPHYAGLQKLYDEYREHGLEILGFPCNQFGAQEPGSDAEIRQFCTSRYSVGFPMFSKIEVNGAGRAPLYAWLTSQPTQPDGPGDVAWNFAKFLIGRDGRVRARFNPQTAPGSNEIRNAIGEALAED
jgi:glutathione peroxidase